MSYLIYDKISRPSDYLRVCVLLFNPLCLPRSLCMHPQRLQMSPLIHNEHVAPISKPSILEPPSKMHSILLSLGGSESPALEVICLIALSLIPFGIWFINQWKNASNSAAQAAEKQARLKLSYQIVQDHLDRRIDELCANLLAVQYDISKIRAKRLKKTSSSTSVSSCGSGKDRKGRKGKKSTKK